MLRSRMGSFGGLESLRGRMGRGRMGRGRSVINRKDQIMRSPGGPIGAPITQMVNKTAPKMGDRMYAHGSLGAPGVSPPTNPFANAKMSPGQLPMPTSQLPGNNPFANAKMSPGQLPMPTSQLPGNNPFGDPSMGRPMNPFGDPSMGRPMNPFGGPSMGRPMNPFGGPSMGRSMNRFGNIFPQMSTPPPSRFFGYPGGRMTPPQTPQRPYGFGPNLFNMSTPRSPQQPQIPQGNPMLQQAQMSQGLPPNISTGFGFPSLGMQPPQMGQMGQMGQQQPPQQGGQMQAGGPSGGGAPTLF